MTFEAGLAYSLARLGRRDEALQALKALEDGQRNPSATQANSAMIDVGLGDAGKAMTWRARAYDGRLNPSILLRPAFDPLRNDRDFQDLLGRIGLPNTV